MRNAFTALINRALRRHVCRQFRAPPSGAPLRVLIAHDDAVVRHAYRRILRETGVSHGIAAFRELRDRHAFGGARSGGDASPSFDAICCDRAEEAVALVQEAASQHQPFAVVFIDVQDSGCDGVWAAVRIREIDPAVEIVLCTTCGGTDALEIGALVPPEEKLSYLPRCSPPSDVRQMIIALASKWLAERRLVKLAYFDSLTELPNRERFRNVLSSAVETAARQNRLLALLYLDLDKFKRVNDTLGHAAGDELLGVVARRLRNNLRCDQSQETIARRGELARLGGDEFVAMLPKPGTTNDAGVVAQRLIQAVREPIQLAGRSIVVTPSVGIAIYPLDGSDAEELLRNADAAMYFSKRKAPGNFSFFHPAMNQAASWKRSCNTQALVKNIRI